MRTHVTATFAVGIFVVCGCGSAGLTPVTGKVMNGNKVLTKGTVTYHPDRRKGNESKNEPLGQIDSNGKYTLQSRNGKGVEPGWYKVTVAAQVPANPKDPYSPPMYLVPKRYVDVTTTPLLVQVKNNAPEGHYDLKLTLSN